MSIRDLLLTQPDTIGGFWVTTPQFYTIRDIELVVSCLFSVDKRSSLSKSIKRVSITRGSKLVFQSINNNKEDGFEGFVDLHTITAEPCVDTQKGIYGFKLKRGLLFSYLYTRTRGTFEQWTKHFNYYTIRENFEANYFHMDILKKFDGKLITKVKCLSSCRNLIAKIMPMTYVERNRDKIINEIILTRSLSHNKIAEMKAIFIEGENLTFVYDVEAKDNLLQVLRLSEPMTKAEQVKVLSTYAGILRYCHKNKVLMRQVSPSHFVLDNSGHPTLYDLSNAVFMDEIRQEMPKLYTGFVAPEILSNDQVSSKADMYTFGVLMHLVVTRKFAFFCESRKRIVCKVLAGEYDTEQPFRGVEREAINLILSCLNKDPSERPGTKTVLENKFLQSSEQTSQGSDLLQGADSGEKDSKAPKRTLSALSRLRTLEDSMKRTISADYLHFKEVQVDIKPYSEKNQKLEIIQRTLDNLKSKTSLCNADDHDNYSDLMIDDIYCWEAELYEDKEHLISTQERLSSLIIPQDSGLKVMKVNSLNRSIILRNKFFK